MKHFVKKGRRHVKPWMTIYDGQLTSTEDRAWSCEGDERSDAVREWEKLPSVKPNLPGGPKTPRGSLPYLVWTRRGGRDVVDARPKGAEEGKRFVLPPLPRAWTTRSKSCTYTFTTAKTIPKLLTIAHPASSSDVMKRLNLPNGALSGRDNS